MDTIRPAAVTADPSVETSAGRPRKRLKGLAQFAGFAPAAVLFGLFFIAPLGLIVVYSFWRTKDYSLVHDWNLGNYRTFIHTRTYIKTFLKTVVIGLLAISRRTPRPSTRSSARSSDGRESTCCGHG